MLIQVIALGVNIMGMGFQTGKCQNMAADAPGTL